ncbi:hypothetical protein [Crystallibacter crystallopoietes]|uniref:hypothetical protein n=1 Tax=Crystallibacter crystallopoietes TaxID=37928 RepID=UPI0003170FDC|nr:hypothetical protein [Arthrobacter crystallopoietes]
MGALRRAGTVGFKAWHEENAAFMATVHAKFTGQPGVVACYRQQVDSAEALPMVLDRATKAALTHRAAAVVIIPHDVQKPPAPKLEHEHGFPVTAPDWQPLANLPLTGDLQAAADLLNAGGKAALLVGQRPAGRRSR